MKLIGRLTITDLVAIHDIVPTWRRMEVEATDLDGGNRRQIDLMEIVETWEAPPWECDCKLATEYCPGCDAAAAEGYDIDYDGREIPWESDDHLSPEHYKMHDGRSE